MSVDWTNLLGLLSDIIGAVLVGRAVLGNTVEKIASQVATAWDYNAHMIAPFAEERYDGVCGLAFLVFGFILQGINEIWVGDIASFLVGVALLSALVALYFLWREEFVRATNNAVLKHLNNGREESSS